jgi:hypothetical protein
MPPVGSICVSLLFLWVLLVPTCIVKPIHTHPSMHISTVLLVHTLIAQHALRRISCDWTVSSLTNGTRPSAFLSKSGDGMRGGSLYFWEYFIGSIIPGNIKFLSYLTQIWNPHYGQRHTHVCLFLSIAGKPRGPAWLWQGCVCPQTAVAPWRLHPGDGLDNVCLNVQQVGSGDELQ